MKIFTGIKVILLCCFVSAIIHLQGQNYSMDGVPIVDCSGFFMDSGGGANPYSANESFTTVICPDNASGTHIRLTFSGVEIGQGDQLCFFDGTDVDAPALACDVDFLPGDPFIVQATAANPSGCLTITFNSDDQDEGQGWSAHIDCIQECQLIEAVLVSTAPEVVPADTGYIDVCVDERISLSGAGVYPQNGVVYQHSDLTSTFEWDFGDGNFAVGLNVTHAYKESGGYIIQLKVTDVMGCTNTNFISQRVRVSTRPSFKLAGNIDSEICAGDTVHLNANVNQIDASSNVSVEANAGSFITEGIRSDSLPLPDGTGAAYETSVSFTQFSPGQVLENVNDLLGICVNMEHSWMRDLEISISCPNGSSIILHDHPGNFGSEVFLGEPIDSDGINPIPGVGYDYCWTPNATNDTWIEYSNFFEPGTLPSGDYSSFETMDDLIGCPLNGEWTIRVEDLWAIDNGFIFSWSINFETDLYPDIETYTPTFLNYSWVNDPTIYYQEPDTIAAAPQNAGTANYTFQVTDDFGCSYDTSLNLNILPFTHPNCYDCIDNIAEINDTIICEGEMVAMDASASSSNPDITFETFPNYEFPGPVHPPIIPYESSITVNSIYPNIISDPVNDILSVCVNIESDWDEDLQILLRAPSGSTLPLSINNGGSGDNYTNTCFSPSASTPIGAGSAPFTGDFQPDGNWDILLGSLTNGDWTLQVSDLFVGAFDFTNVISWSISFNTQNNVDYTWSSDGTLSCTSCPDPQVSPATTTTYIVESLDNFNCAYSDSITVGVIQSLAAPEVSCFLSGEEEITFEWLPIEGFSDYEININNTGWTGPVNALNYVIDGLSPMEDVYFEVRVYTGNISLNCLVEIGSSQCQYDACNIISQVESLTDVSCYNYSDGAAVLNISGGLAPYTFNLNGVNVLNSNASFTDLEEGNHIIIITDASLCADTISFSVNQPDSITPSANIDNQVSCYGGSDAMVTANASGGTGGYEFYWSSNPLVASAIADNLSSGDYTVTAIDANGCSNTAIVTITEPDSLTLSLLALPASCANTNQGSISSTVGGGTGIYSYTWSNGNTDPDLTGASSGNYCVTVSDENGCFISNCAEIVSPEALVIESIGATSVDCNGNNSGAAYVVATGGTPDYTYSWNDGLGQVSDTAVFLNAGLYEVTVTDINNCQITASVEVTEPELLSAMAGSTDVSCFGGSDGGATVSPLGGISPYSFQWNDAINQTAISVEDLTEGNYTVTVTDNNGCTAQASTNVNQPQAPISINISQTKFSCFDMDNSEAAAIVSGGTGTAYAYLWSNGQNTATSVNLAPEGYHLTVTDENGCTSIDSIGIDELEDVFVNVVLSKPSCYGLSDGSMGVNIVTGGSGAGYTFSWNTTPVQSSELIENLAGDIEYTVTVTDDQGCMQTNTAFLHEPPQITFDLENTPANCFGSNDGTATVNNVQGENTTYSYEWSSNANGQTDSTAINLSAGIYTLIISDENDCVVSGTVEIEQPSQINIEFEVADNRCSGENIGAIATTVSGGISAYTYEWSTQETDKKIGSLFAGNYTLSVTDANGCLQVDSAEVQDPEAISASLIKTDVTCFSGRDGSFSIEALGGTPPYTYSTDNEYFNGSTSIVGLSAGEYNVYVKDAYECLWYEPASIENPPEFVVEIDPEEAQINVGDSILLSAFSTNGTEPVQYFWSAPYEGTLGCTDCLDTYAKPQNTIHYSLNGEDANGCRASTSILVVVIKDRMIAVPTGFSPNGDYINDLLLVHGKERTKVKMFRVFDRWGELLYEKGDFEVNDPNIGWDGTYRSTEMNTGTYIWFLEVEYIDGVEEVFKGQTTLIR